MQTLLEPQMISLYNFSLINLIPRLFDATEGTVYVSGRNVKDLSQEELGKIVGVSFSTINRWENNKSIPSKKHICVIENLCEKNNIDFKEGK